MKSETLTFNTLNEAFKFLDTERLELEAKQKQYQNHVHELFKQLARELEIRTKADKKAKKK